MALRDQIGLAFHGGRPMLIGAVLSGIWLLLVAMFWLLGPEATGTTSGLTRLATVLAVLLPLVLIWMAVGLAGAIAALRAEAADLRLRLGQMREAAMGMPRAHTATMTSSTTMPPMPRAQMQPTAAPAPRTADPSPAAAPRPQGNDVRQTAMAFDAPASVAVASDDLIRALNFPEGPDDVETLAALRAALRDHDCSRVIRSAQDVITLLSGQGLYMDSLQPGSTRPELWRRLAQGARGDAMKGIGAIDDADALELTAAMLKGDEIFRDTAHHFLRHFDLTVTRTVPSLNDDQIIRLADTRAARAFMLLGRAANVFG